MYLPRVANPPMTMMMMIFNHQNHVGGLREIAVVLVHDILIAVY